MKLYKGPWVRKVSEVGAVQETWCPPDGSIEGVDLRTIPQMAANGGMGLGVFCFEDHIKPGLQYTKLRSGQALDLIQSKLMTESDPSGISAPKPLLPNRNNILNIRCGGLKREIEFKRNTAHYSKVIDTHKEDYSEVLKNGGNLHRKYLGWLGQRYGVSDPENIFISKKHKKAKPIKPGTSFTESFNQADSGTLGPDLTWAEVSGTWATVSNTFDQSNGSVNGHARAEHDVSSTDHFAKVHNTYAISSGQGGVGVCVRFGSSDETLYHGSNYESGTLDYRWVAKWVAGSRTDLIIDSTYTLPAAPYDVKLDVSGSDLELLFGATSAWTGTDTAITGGTRGGIFNFRTVTYRGDDFEVNDGGGGSSIPPPSSMLMGVGL